ncbi:MAG TPA: SBBP repeat-containing protein [Pyrinomonadaceae bacterium]|jgi:hypothetical protein|nr:SBBP repeat-containing protein [Pyrinomonadaceae bacterium]
MRSKILPLVIGFSQLITGAYVSARSPDQQTTPTPTNTTLVWNTFVGGLSIFESTSGIAADKSGNVYVAGDSNVSWGAPVRAFTNGDDGFVAKLDANGNLIWNTFLGGSSSDEATGVTVDSSGNIYVVGWSSASWGSPVRGFSGGYDAWAAKVDATGHLIWNTFLGGPGTMTDFDYGRAIAVDDAGSVYVGGESPGTWGSPVTVAGFGSFIAKLDANGSLIWNSFLGSTGAFALALDGAGNVYAAGGGGCGWGTPINGCSGDSEAFVAKLDANGKLKWNTFLGGTGYDFGYGVALDALGNVYVSGISAASWGSPVRPHTGGGEDAFVAKLDPTGKRVWNTFLGGNALDFGFALTVDPLGNSYVAGRSDAAWGSPIRSFAGGADDAFVAKLDPNGNLVWSMFLGGTSYDQANAVTCSNGQIYVAGESDASWGSPVRPYTNVDGFVAKISDPPQTNSNLIDDAQFFVRQHYLDFLNREPDQAGWNFWTGNIAPCGSDPSCLIASRVNVSAAFFLSIEFQQTGYLVERIYKTAYGDASATSSFSGTLMVPGVRLNEFIADTRQIAQGVGSNNSKTTKTLSRLHSSSVNASRPRCRQA